MKKLSFGDFTLESVDLSKDPMLFEQLIEGQIAALKDFGVEERILMVQDTVPPPGTYGVVARSDFGDIIGSQRLYTRAAGQSLPIESAGSPLDPAHRAEIAAEDGICEIGGLWVDKRFSGRFLSRKMVAFTTAYAYELGFTALVSLGHLRSHKFIAAPLGYEVAEHIPPMPYPDPRFLSLVIWHRLGMESALSHLEPRAPRNANVAAEAEKAPVS